MFTSLQFLAFFSRYSAADIFGRMHPRASGPQICRLRPGVLLWRRVSAAPIRLGRSRTGTAAHFRRPCSWPSIDGVWAREATLLYSGRDLLDVAPDIRNVRTVPALDAADLDGEIKSLIERSDAEELKLTEAMMPC